MLFSRVRTIIFINREKIRWTKGRVPAGQLLEVPQEVVCSEANLQTVLAEIIEHSPKKVRIVVGEEFAYVTRLRKVEMAGQIETAIQSLIPENLDEGWDSKDEGANHVQVMAIQQQVFAVLKKALLENKLRLEAMEAESVSISRMVAASKDEAVLLARYDGKVLLEVVRNGSVLATRIFFQFPSQEQIQEFLDYMISQKSIVFKTIYLQDESGELAKIFQALGLNVQAITLDPMVGIGQKKDIDGPDSEVLNIILGENEKSQEAGHLADGATGRTLREKILAVLFGIILLGGLAVAYYLYQSRI